MFTKINNREGAQAPTHKTIKIMDKRYNEQNAIHALIYVLDCVVSEGNQEPEFDDMDMVEITDGNRFQPMILLSDDEVEDLTGFLVEQGASDKVTEYFKSIK